MTGLSKTGGARVAIAVPLVLYAWGAGFIGERYGVAVRKIDLQAVRRLNGVFLRPHPGIEVAREIIDFGVFGQQASFETMTDGDGRMYRSRRSESSA